ncbi:isoflavone 2'-hydroxylase-like [Coffea eugenioides]|uniref:isoflavone 2'-hydroxylase-like n=2 Tax=Coffea eugenioides TaxID=49369 RepID=UPI000F6046CE|nr:isoflavone 2'-hydroxylase-like [Coffea eugenioides]
MGATYCYLLLFPFLYLLTNQIIRKFQNLPPSPPLSLPIIGHLHLIQKPLHRGLAKISDKYGPIQFLHFGSRPVLLVSSPSAAEECFTKNDIIFANRPRFLAGKHLGYNYTTLGWVSYGQHWRNLRRIATLEILSATRIQAYTSIRVNEVHSLIKYLLKASKASDSSTVEMKSAFFGLTLNIMMRMIAGKRYYGDDAQNKEEAARFKEIVKETFQLSGATNIADYIPLLKFFGQQKLETKLKTLQAKRDQFLQDLIEEHRRTVRSSDSEKGNKTMIDVLLSLQQTESEYYTDEIVKGMIVQMLSAGTDTSSGTMEWALSLLLNNPQVLKKAQQEIDAYAGQSRLINDSDLGQLPYLRAIINETLRICPVAPILVPHVSSQECCVGGYNIPGGTLLLVNLWAMQNDPKVWEEPTKFRPERFISLEGQRDGFVFMPFGFGRRGCPGENLAMRVVGLTLGLLIQCFEWERVGEELVDMTEGEGLTMPRAKELMAKCKPRREMVKLLSQS